jgi:light-regulated signal transduction histidine kinase (bacteriophytochrome)
VDGYAAMLEEDYGQQFDEEGRRYLRALREGATRMGRLIEDLLTFSRLGRQVLEPGTVETGSLVESAWQAALEANPGNPAVLEAGPLPPTRGDALLLRQVWINLLDNAVKYSSRTAAPRIQVRGEESGTETVFHVTDNGAGFDMRYYDKLFQVFQRLHSENDFPGTGVGLAIVQRIVARHGGRVWASSQPGQGAVFSFALPVPS